MQKRILQTLLSAPWFVESCRSREEDTLAGLMLYADGSALLESAGLHREWIIDG